jgi:hypothetical protein
MYEKIDMIFFGLRIKGAAGYNIESRHINQVQSPVGASNFHGRGNTGNQ